jgi:hypothetical protein
MTGQVSAQEFEKSRLSSNTAYAQEFRALVLEAVRGRTTSCFPHAAGPLPESQLYLQQRAHLLRLTLECLFAWEI